LYIREKVFSYVCEKIKDAFTLEHTHTHARHMYALIHTRTHTVKRTRLHSVINLLVFPGNFLGFPTNSNSFTKSQCPPFSVALLGSFLIGFKTVSRITIDKNVHFTPILIGKTLAMCQGGRYISWGCYRLSNTFAVKPSASLLANTFR